MDKEALQEFRISKYNSDQRKGSIYLEDDWTNICDVGKKYNGHTLTLPEYVDVENKYLSFVEQLCAALNISQLQITDLEDYSHNCSYADKSVICSIPEILAVVRDCLREKYWCKLQSDNFYLHFGYDLYLYVGSLLDLDCVRNTSNKLGLYVESIKSPYNSQTKDSYC